MDNIMTSDRTKRIKSITNEVKEFHPILNELFIRLPDVSNVYYTHGPNEMGADFIIEKFDNTLSTNEYIGVIAKIGKVSQNHSSIDEQIKECSVDRKVHGGTRKIYLNQI